MRFPVKHFVRCTNARRCYSAFASTPTRSELLYMAKEGKPEDQRKLAEDYLTKGTLADRQEAIHWMTKAAEQGELHSQWRLACIHLHAPLPIRDHENAEERANCHHTEAHMELGYLLPMGAFSRQLDFIDAMFLFRRVALAFRAYFHLAKQSQLDAEHMLKTLKEPPSNDKTIQSQEAVQWIKQAAEGGLPEAQRLIGDLYTIGVPGVDVDKEKARHWHQLARKNERNPSPFQYSSVAGYSVAATVLFLGIGYLFHRWRANSSELNDTDTK